MATNDMTVTLKLKRIEVCDLLMACIVTDNMAEVADKWSKLHDKLKSILDEFDAKH